MLSLLKQHLFYGNSDPKGGGGDQSGGQEAPTTSSNAVINPKLKQFYEVKARVEPMYDGGKVMMLSPCHFLCQCGPALKVVSTMILPPVSQVTNGSSSSKTGDNGVVEDETKPKENKDFLKESSFGVIGSFEVEMDPILTFDACPASFTLVTGHSSGLLRVWDLNERSILKTIRSFHHLPMTQVNVRKISYPNSQTTDEKVINLSQFSDNLRTNLIWASISGSSVKIWDFGGSLVTKSIQVDNVPSLGFAKWDEEVLNGGDLETPGASESRISRLFIAEASIYVVEGQGSDFRIVQTLEGHFSQVSGIEFYRDMVLSAARDKVLILWSRKDWSKVKTIPFPGAIEGILLSPSFDLYVALAPSDLRVFDIGKNLLSKESAVQLHGEVITGLSPCFVEGETFLISTNSCTLYLVSCKAKKKKSRDVHVQLEVRKKFVGSLDEILTAVIWNGTKIGVGNNSHIIKVYDLERQSCEFLNAHKDIVLSLAVRDEWLVSGSKDNKIIIWGLDSNEPKSILDGHMDSVASVTFSPTAADPIVYSVGEDKFLKVWDMNRCVKSVIAHEKEMHSVHCSTNGTLLLTSSRDKTAKIWNASSLKLEGTLKGHKKGVWDAKFSDWDQLAVTASADTTLKIWNINSFECLQTLQGHLSSVLQAKFINNGLQILSSSSDGTFKSWDVRSSTCVATNEGSGNDKIWALDSTPDGSLVVTGSADSILTIWRDVTESKVVEAQEKRKKLLEDEQRLTNIIRQENWADGILLAIELDRPFTLLKIIREIPDPKILKPIISDLSMDHLSLLASYVNKWNTNTKTCTEAQILLNILLESYHPARLEFLDTVALLPYTDKHFKRMKRHLEKIAVIKYFGKAEN